MFVCALGVPNPGASQSQRARSRNSRCPTRIVIDVDSPERDLYRIAIPNLLGSSATQCAQAADVLRNDLKLVSLFNVLDPRSFIANLQAEGLGITKAPWSSVGAQGVVKGQIGGNTVDMRFYEIARGETPLLSKTYRGGEAELRGFMHDFANEILRILTGKAGSFGTRFTFTKKLGPGRKDVYVSDFDGPNQGRVSNGSGINMLSSFGALKGIWFSILSHQRHVPDQHEEQRRPGDQQQRPEHGRLDLQRARVLHLDARRKQRDLQRRDRRHRRASA